MTYPAQAPFAVRMGQLLALEGAEGLTDVRLAQRIGEGLPVDAADRLFGGLAGGGFSVGDIVSESTLRRARDGRGLLSRRHSEQLYEISRVLDAALRAYKGDRERANAFLSRPHPMLEGEKPFDLARTSSAGADAVVSLIERAMAGVSV